MSARKDRKLVHEDVKTEHTQGLVRVWNCETGRNVYRIVVEREKRQCTEILAVRVESRTNGLTSKNA